MYQLVVWLMFNIRLTFVLSIDLHVHYVQFKR